MVVIFASRTGIFTALLSSEDVLPPVTTLLDVARRQIERAGGAPDLDTGNTGSGERASRRIPSWRRRCRPTRLPGSG